MNIHIFAGVKETYHKPTLNVASVAYMIGEDAYHFSYAHQDYSVTKLLGHCFLAMAESIDQLGTSIVHGSTCVVINPFTGWDDAVLKRLIEAPNHEKALEAIKKNTQMDDIDAWEMVARGLVILIKSGSRVKFTTKFKEIPGTVVEALVCDSAAAQAIAHTHDNPDNGLESGELLAKSKKLKAKNRLPNLLVDNCLFNWLPTQETPVYYTLNTELENKKAKSKKARPLVDKGFVYYGGSNRRLRVAGRTSAEDRYNVIILKDKCEYIEKVINHQTTINSKIYSTRQAVIYRMGKLMGGGISNRIEEDDFSMITADDHGDMYTLTCPREDLSYVFNPPRLAFKLKRILENNTTRLWGIINNNEEAMGLKVTDVTSSFYFTDEKGNCKILPTITTSTKDLRLKDIPTPLDITINPKVLLKYDIPTRNELARFAKDEPKISIVTWEFDPHIIGYAFVIQTVEGWLYYSSEYGSRHLLKTARKSQR